LAPDIPCTFEFNSLYEEIFPCYFFQGIPLKTRMDAAFGDDVVDISGPVFPIFPVFFPVSQGICRGDWFDPGCIHHHAPQAATACGRIVASAS
jgi:hypothetical protein